MSRTVEQEVFKFEELSDDAKEHARTWWRSHEALDFNPDCVIDDAITIAALFGLSLDGKRYAISWQINSGYGDSAAVTGSYQYKAGALKAVKEYTPQDTELHAIVAALQDAQRKNFYRVYGALSNSGNRSPTQKVSLERDNPRWGCYAEDITDADAFESAFNDFAAWIVKRISDDWTYRMSDESVDESIIINEYEFLDSGEFYG